MATSRRVSTIIHIDGHPVPTLVVVERRTNCTYSIASKQLVLRLPLGAPAQMVHEQLERLRHWATKVLHEKPQIWARFRHKEYQSGDVLTVGKRHYTLHISEEIRNSHSALLKNGIIYLTLSQNGTGATRQKAVKTLLSRVVAQDYQKEIEQRVLALNERTFRRPITSVQLKYNRTNWGSCSSKSNLNFSTRLLFAPESVQDYVMLHELAHLVELNHSPRFWALVSQYMPEYEKAEQWLKVHGSTCDF